jgi:hypothetical protein
VNLEIALIWPALNNGLELVAHKAIAEGLDADAYFTHLLFFMGARH